MATKEMPRQSMWACHVRGTSRKWHKFQRNVRPLRTGLDTEVFGRWDGVESEVGVEGYVGFGYKGE